MTDHNRHNQPRYCGESGAVSGIQVVQQTDMVLNNTEDLTINLMEQICSRANLNQAYKRVKANKGCAGIDKMTVDELLAYLKSNGQYIIRQLLNGTYKPQPLLGVKIPKSGGGERQLGIPTVVDRLIQQAIYQVLSPIFDAEFSTSSYGFRPGIGAHDALQQSQEYVKSGRRWVVDIDLEKYFDRVNHDRLMMVLARKLSDKRPLQLIRKFLQAGIMQDGVSTGRSMGTPQGGPLSPLLANIVLDELDKELERRGHKFCRYADDCNIYVQSKRAGDRVYASIKNFLENRLKLKVNETKSAVALVSKRVFLSYRLRTDGQLTLPQKTLDRLKDKIRTMTKRNTSKSFAEIIRQLGSYLSGWLRYFKLSNFPSYFRELDSWIRRKLRCYRLKQRKGYWSIATFLMGLGVPERNAQQIGSSGKGWWRLSLTSGVNRAMDNAWFRGQNLYSLEENWKKLVQTSSETAVCYKACTVV
jgi:group II intron reverse transcriptase/maturase